MASPCRAGVLEYWKGGMRYWSNGVAVFAIEDYGYAALNWSDGKKFIQDTLFFLTVINPAEMKVYGTVFFCNGVRNLISV